MMRRIFAALSVCSLTVPAMAAQPVTGRWLSVGGQSLVELAPCGRAVCGHIVKILKPDPKRPTIDVNNPDPARRTRPVEGLTILSGLVDDGEYWVGKIYDPRSGKSYDSRVKREANGSLTVKGCVMFMCRGQNWTAAR